MNARYLVRSHAGIVNHTVLLSITRCRVCHFEQDQMRAWSKAHHDHCYARSANEMPRRIVLRDVNVSDLGDMPSASKPIIGRTRRFSVRYWMKTFPSSTRGFASRGSTINFGGAPSSRATRGDGP